MNSAQRQRIRNAEDDEKKIADLERQLGVLQKLKAVAVPDLERQLAEAKNDALERAAKICDRCRYAAEAAGDIRKLKEQP